MTKLTERAKLKYRKAYLAFEKTYYYGGSSGQKNGGIALKIFF